MPQTIGDNSDIPSLGDAYGHARKAYGLASALLMAWELIGVELDATPVESLKLKLKSPQAAPYVLIVLIVYFGFRMTIEWYQSDIRRRERRASKVDLWVAHGIAAASLALYAYQTISKVQLASIVSQSRVLAFIMGVTIGQGLYAVRVIHRSKQWRTDRVGIGLIVAVAVFVPVCGVTLLHSSETYWDSSLPIVGSVGVAIGLGLMALVDWMRGRFDGIIEVTSSTQE